MGAKRLADTLAINLLVGILVLVTILHVLVCVIAISTWLVRSFRHYWKSYKSEMESDFERERACCPHKKSAREQIIKMGYPLTHVQDAGGNGNGKHPTLTHLLFTKINESRESHDRDLEIGREHILEFTCKLCSKDLIGDDSDNKTSGWVTVMPDCLHMCHAECVPQWIKYLRSCCPYCGRTVEKKDLKEVSIRINPLVPKA